MFTSGTIDYLTITAKHDSNERAALDAVWDSIAHDDATKGLDEKPARALGYVGSKIGTMFLGANPDGAMFRASGDLAEIAAQTFAWIGGQFHVTRMDAQLTWGYGQDIDHYFARWANEIRAAQAQSKAHPAPQVRHIRSFGKGDTVSIGSRSSEVYIRIYDKSREQVTNPSEGLVRYEVELKGERALQALRYYRLCSDRNEAVFEIVDSWCRDRDVPVPWTAVSLLDWPEIGRPETDAERKLKWLESHVKGSVDYLISKGHRKLVLEVLGLDNTY